MPVCNNSTLLALSISLSPCSVITVREELLAGKYQSVTDVIGDLRTMLENAYRYYGPANATTKKGLRLEHMMEQKIALLPKYVSCSFVHNTPL